MSKKIKISGAPKLLWLLALSLIIIAGIYLVNGAHRRAENAVTVFASGGEYTPPNCGFADLLR